MSVFGFVRPLWSRNPGVSEGERDTAGCSLKDSPPYVFKSDDIERSYSGELIYLLT